MILGSYAHDSINCKPQFFADNTCLVYSSLTPSMINTAMNQDLQNISIWFKANKLTVHPSKSNVLTINPKISKAPSIVNVTLNNIVLNQSNSVKYLGVIIDSKLNFDTHIKKLAHRISKTVEIMFKSKQYMPKKALQALCYSLIHTHLLYGLPVWGSTHPSYLKKLVTLQNKAVKLIGGGLYNDKASPFYSQLKILKLPYLYKLEIGKFVDAHFQNCLPLNISNYFTLPYLPSYHKNNSE